ncbi:GD23616 [Drosophila simulans]|uniref:Carboxylic ester hydrolase n=1 Tax=Drosophila simulans TaxID=7240 RepID=B4Q7U2_DROSI|nr:GD23616 [Drosophila simulans]
MPRFFQLTWALLLILIGFTTAVTFIGDDPVVELSLGRIQGDTMQSFRNKTIYAFRGIRYAQSPVGQLRFANPVQETSWGDEVFKATSDSLVCPQPGVVSFMSEDCLKLNVFTKSFEEKFPVMVYIHGGANVLGSGHSSYEAGPQYLLDQDVVFVAFNYRLGALGFLSTNSSETKGNFGFLDQVMALEWVRDHISHFGGDPELVTIFGMSAGSMAVSLHLASPLSAGLFHRAILMSGSATNHFDIDNIFWTRKLARELGCPLYDPKDVVECLRNETWTRIVEVCKAWETYQLVNMKWNYEIDGHFLPNHPTELIKEGNFNKVPLLISYTANEFDYNANGCTIGEKLKDFYLGDNTTEINSENIGKFGQVFSDAYIGHGVHRLVQLASHFTPVYYMRMDYVGDQSLSAPLNGENKPVGVGHADDLHYVMPGYWYGALMSANDSDVFMMERLTSWFSHFAKTGTPLNSTDIWPPCNSTVWKMLYNGVVTQVGSPGYSNRYAVWDELFPTHARGGGAAWKLSFAVAVATGVASRLIGKLM